MHVFLTGGAGFIGSATAQHLLSRGDRVTTLDAFAFGYDPALKEANAARLQGREGFTLVRGDIRDADLLERIFAADRPDVVVHLAARAGVRQSLADPASYADINITGTIRILETMKRHDVKRMVFASSSSVYGSRRQGPFAETDPVDTPVSPYAATKRAGEIICATYKHLYDIQSTCLRFFTVYGPHQRPEMAIHLFGRLILAGEPIPMFGDGSSMRDYTYVDDIVAGVVAAIDRPLGLEIVNLGNSSPIRLDGLIASLGRALGRQPQIQQLPDQLGDVPVTFAQPDKARSLLGWEATTSIHDGLDRFAAWLQNR